MMIYPLSQAEPELNPDHGAANTDTPRPADPPAADTDHDRTAASAASALTGGWPSVADALSYLAAVDHVETNLSVAVPAKELVDLYRRLRSQPVIEEAKGILMGHYGIQADIAFVVLKRWSQDNNVKLCSIAQALVDAVAHQPSSQVRPDVVIEQTFAQRSAIDARQPPSVP